MAREFPSERIRKYAKHLELSAIGKGGQESKVPFKLLYDSSNLIKPGMFPSVSGTDPDN